MSLEMFSNTILGADLTTAGGAVGIDASSPLDTWVRATVNIDGLDGTVNQGLQLTILVDDVPVGGPGGLFYKENETDTTIRLVSGAFDLETGQGFTVRVGSTHSGDDSGSWPGILVVTRIVDAAPGLRPTVVGRELVVDINGVAATDWGDRHICIIDDGAIIDPSGATSFDVSSHLNPVPIVGNIIQVVGGTELMLVTGVTGNVPTQTLTVIRGWGGTTAQAIANGMRLMIVAHMPTLANAGTFPATGATVQSNSVLDRVDVKTSTRAEKTVLDNIADGTTKVVASNMRGTDNALLASGYTPPNNTGIADAKTAAEAVDTRTSGITLLANWLRALVRKDAADSTALTEINNGGGSYAEAQHSLEADKTVGDIKQAALAKFATQDTGLPTAAAGSIAQLSQAATIKGDGDIPVDHNTGGADNLRLVNQNGNGIDNAAIRAYVKSEYDASPTQATLRAGPVSTAADGRWVNIMMLNQGVTYTIVFSHPNFNVATKDVTP